MQLDAERPRIVQGYLEPVEANRIRTKEGLSVVAPEKWFSSIDDSQIASPFGWIELRSERRGVSATKVAVAEINVKLIPGAVGRDYVSVFEVTSVLENHRQGQTWNIASGFVGERFRRRAFWIWRGLGKNLLMIEYYPGFDTDSIPEIIWQYIDTVHVPKAMAI